MGISTTLPPHALLSSIESYPQQRSSPLMGRGKAFRHIYLLLLASELESQSRPSYRPSPVVAQRVEAELVGDLCGVHGVGQVLLVGKDQQNGLAQLVLVEHAVQLIARLANTVAIVRIDHEDHSLRVLVVVAPERADLVLATNIPHSE